jgi:hypothetical protein
MTTAITFAEGRTESDSTTGITDGGIMLFEPWNSQNDMMGCWSNVEANFFFIVGNAEN